MKHAADIPSEMRALVLDEYRVGAAEAVRGLKLAQRPVPVPGHGEVLVRMEAAPCNPSDLLLLQGLYGVRKPLPAVPGWEGAGTVVASGGGLYARTLLGRRVACGGQTVGDGTWAEYHAAPATGCALLPDDMDFELGATSIINPMTCIGLLERIRKGGHRAAIQTAAASQVGQMMIRLCRSRGIPLVNVVRRPAQAKELAAAGADHVLVSGTPGFETKLSELAHAVGATIALDAVAGSMPGTLLAAMPRGSTVLVYGALSMEKAGGIDPIDLIFGDKSVQAFYLGNWLKGRGLIGMMSAVRGAQRLIAEGTLKTRIGRRIPLAQAREGLLEHLAHPGEGKAILTMR